MISTGDSCNIQSRVRRPSSHKGARSQIIYPLPVELPKSIVGGQYASVWSKTLCKLMQTTLKTHLMKGLFWTVEQWKGTREHDTVEKPWTSSIGRFLKRFNDLHTCNVQSRVRRPLSHGGGPSSNTHCALNSLDLSLKNRERWRNKSQCPKQENK